MNEILVPWESQSGAWWNQTCALICEHFGLPGVKYITTVDTNFMKFVFFDNNDALMCRLLVSDIL